MGVEAGGPCSIYIYNVNVECKYNCSFWAFSLSILFPFSLYRSDLGSAGSGELLRVIAQAGVPKPKFFSFFLSNSWKPEFVPESKVS